MMCSLIRETVEIKNYICDGAINTDQTKGDNNVSEHEQDVKKGRYVQTYLPYDNYRDLMLLKTYTGFSLEMLVRQAIINLTELNVKKGEKENG